MTTALTAVRDLLLRGLREKPNAPATEMGQPVFTGKATGAASMWEIMDAVVDELEGMGWPTSVNPWESQLSTSPDDVGSLFFYNLGEACPGYLQVSRCAHVGQVHLSIRYDFPARLMEIGLVAFAETESLGGMGVEEESAEPVCA